MTQGRALLKAFLKKHDIAKKKAGRDLGVTSQAILAWLENKSQPTLANRIAIETWTQGEVPASSWPPVKTKRVTPFVAAS